MHLEKSMELQKHIGIHLLNYSLLALLDHLEENTRHDVDSMDGGSEHGRTVSNMSSYQLSLDDRSGESEVGMLKSFDQFDTTAPELEVEVQWDWLRRSEDVAALPENDVILAPFVQRFLESENHLSRIGPVLARAERAGQLYTAILKPQPRTAIGKVINWYDSSIDSTLSMTLLGSGSVGTVWKVHKFHLL